MRRFLVLVTTSLFSLHAMAAEGEPCHSFAESTIGGVLKVFHDTGTADAKKREQLSVIFGQAVDTDWIGKFVLGQYWRSASDEEKKAFLEAYRDYITNTYVSKFKDENGMNVDAIKVVSFGASNQGSGKYQVKTIVENKGDEDVHVDYLIDDAGGKCKVHDITVEGVSLLSSQRSEFASLASTGGVKAVIAAMQKRNLAAAK